MVFWIVAAAMTAVVTLGLVWPLLRRQGARSGSAAEHDVEVYAAQLRELGGDLDRGTIAEIDAASARAEIGRRLLRASERVTAPTGASARSLRRPITLSAVILVAVAVPAFAFSLYGRVGDPQFRDQPLAFREQPKSKDEFDLANLVQKAEARLKTDPKDGNGWEVLAPIYLKMNRPQDAANAFRQALALNGPSATRFGGLGEALTETSSGEVTDEARAAFEKAVQINPAYLPAKFFLALDASQEERAADAETRWGDLIAESPPNAPWLKIAQAGLADAKQRLGKPVVAASNTPAGDPATPDAAGAGGADSFKGPDAATIAAASEMPAGDRQSMIEGMVSQLAARLKDNPDDVEGWKRLIRSYTVLGKTDEATTALGDAQRSFSADSAAAREIAAFAGEIGLSTPEEGTPR